MIIRFYLQPQKKEESLKISSNYRIKNYKNWINSKLCIKNHPLLMIKTVKINLKIKVIFISFSKLNIAFYSFFCIVRTLNNKI